MKKQRKKWSACDAGLVTAALQRLLFVLGEDAEEVFLRMILDQEYVGGLVKTARRRNNDSSTPINSAVAIMGMGSDFLGVNDAVEHANAKRSGTLQDAFRVIPYSPSTLLRCRGTHILVAVPPLSIKMIIAGITTSPSTRNLQSVVLESNWHHGKPFMDEVPEAAWWLISKSALANSFGNNLTTQHGMLEGGEVTPPASVLFYTIVTYFLKTGHRLFPEIQVRTSTKTMHSGFEYWVMMGSTAKGFWLDLSAHQHTAEHIGLAVAELPN